MPRPFKILSVDRVFDGFFAVDRAIVTFEVAGGAMSEPHERLCVERGDSAAVLLHLVESDTFLLVRQFRYPCVSHDDPWLLEAVAGKVEAGESPEAAARREALEETGFELKELEPVGAFYGSPGGLSELTHVFYAAVHNRDRVAPGGGADDGEDVEVVAVPANQALRMATTGEIRDGKALIALLWFSAKFRSGQTREREA